MDWFDVDKKGLQKILQERGYEFIIYELVQNALDENSTKVTVDLEWAAGIGTVIVTDDSPEGFQDLKHAWTLFAESPKKQDATKRGRFDLGEKLVLACCQDAMITTTTGRVTFNSSGRRVSRTKTTKGSTFYGTIRCRKGDFMPLIEAAHNIIPPDNKKLLVNGCPVYVPEHLSRIEVKALPTVFAGEDGRLRRSNRNTHLDVYALPADDKEGYLHEMGIPVCPVGGGMPWHIDVGQRVPLGLDRNSVPNEFLKKVSIAILNEMHDSLKDSEAANQEWVRRATGSNQTKCRAIHSVLDLRFGEKRAAYDPTDREANKKFVASGGVIVHGSQMTKQEWDMAKRANAIVPAGKITPSNSKIKNNPEGEDDSYPEHRVTQPMRRLVAHIARISSELLDKEVTVRLALRMNENAVAWYGGSTLSFNVGKLGRSWFEDNDKPLAESALSLMLHELAHEYEEDHLSENFAEAGFDLGAKLAVLVHQRPDLFSDETYMEVEEEATA